MHACRGGVNTRQEQVVTNTSANPVNWSYARRNYQDRAVLILGDSIFQDVTNPGEGFVRGGAVMNYNNVNLE